MSFTIDPVMECVGNYTFMGTKAHAVTLLPRGEGSKMTWVLNSGEPKTYDQFVVGKTYKLTLTVEEVPGA